MTNISMDYNGEKFDLKTFLNSLDNIVAESVAKNAIDLWNERTAHLTEKINNENVNLSIKIRLNAPTQVHLL